MSYNILGKEVRGRFGLPSGVIATNSDTARWIIENVPQIGVYVGKATTIEHCKGNREDMFVMIDGNWSVNADGFSNPGLVEMVESFRELREIASDVFLMPQIGESEPDKFGYCVSEFEKGGAADGYEANISCGHAKKGGIWLSDSETVRKVFASMRKETAKPLVGKINASTPNLVDLVGKAIEGGATAISMINTLPGPNPEIKNKFGGYSGRGIFPKLVETAELIKRHYDVPLMFMGGISGTREVRRLLEIDQQAACLIGTVLAERNSEGTKEFFYHLERDLNDGTNVAESLVRKKEAAQYQPFMVKEIVGLSEELRLFRFDKNLDADPGQFVFLKVGDMRVNDGKVDDEYSKPFSVANDRDNLELVIRRVGAGTSKIFELGEGQMVRIKGPYGKSFELPRSETVVYVGAGCGIAPIHHAATHHQGKKRFVLGARTASELVYLDQFKQRGEVIVSTDDGSKGYQGLVGDLLNRYLEEREVQGVNFFNCGPEVMLKHVDGIERNYTDEEKIYHLVERMTKCGVGICGKCSIPNGKRACVDGPVFSAIDFTPGLYRRDESGRKRHDD